MSITKYFVENQNIPDYIQRDFETFTAFIDAYYEWIENKVQNGSADYSDVYQALGNPAYLANNNHLINDVDSTIDEFIDYFADEVSPITLDGMKSDPRFFIKHAREMFLAKGTPKSFRLFFKLFFNDQVQVYEGTDNILRASDGKYLSFPTLFLLSTGPENDIDSIEYALANLLDENRNFIATIIGGLVVDKQDGKSVLKLTLSFDAEIEYGKTYYIQDSNNPVLELKTTPMLTVSSVDVVNGGSGFEINDNFYIDDQTELRRFPGYISGVQKGYVEGIKVRNRGAGYTVNDQFEFRTLDDLVVGTFQPTAVTGAGEVSEIAGVKTKTGWNNEGFDSTVLNTATIPLTSYALIDNLPTIKQSISNSFTYVLAEPYGNASGSAGSGFQAVPYTNTIGKATSATLNDNAYFLTDSDITISAPISMLIENSSLEIGDRVSLQKFRGISDPRPLDDDPERLTMMISVVAETFLAHDSDGSTHDSEYNRNLVLRLPVGFDSDNFSWTLKEITFRTDESSTNMFKPFTDTLDSESQWSYTVGQGNFRLILDGGDSYDFSNLDSEVDGGEDWGLADPDTDSVPIDGGTFDFRYSTIHYATIVVGDDSLDQLEDYHWDKLDSDTTVRTTTESFTTKYDTLGLNIVPVTQNDVGYWYDTGYYGEVVSIDPTGQMVKAVPLLGFSLPSTEEFAGMTEDKYELVIATPFDNDGSISPHHGLPLANVVHKLDQLELSYTIGTVSTTGKRFWTQDGFISSSYGGYIQDNYYYSNYSYTLKTKTPLTQWKQKFKEMLHPAGLIMTSEYVADIHAVSDGIIASVDAKKNKNIISGVRFDMSNEYIEKRLYGDGVNADSLFYRTNAFEFLNPYVTTAVALDASIMTNTSQPFLKQQQGNSYWDYEPVGHILTDNVGTEINNHQAYTNKFTTQDSDGSQQVLENYTYWMHKDGTLNDSHKTGDRIKWTNGSSNLISKVQFEDGFITKYSTIRKDIPEHFFATFSDSDEEFVKIRYSKVVTDSDQYFPLWSIKRGVELIADREREFNIACKENKELTWTDGGITYYDFDAYERKWNYINTLRDKNIEGYKVSIANSYSEYIYGSNRSERRRNIYTLNEYVDSFRVKTNKPYHKQAWDAGDIVYDIDPSDLINTIRAYPTTDVVSVVDVKELMRSRRDS